jgi:predicted  nucleic acid-binding Zn-ribbon protein
MISRIAEKNELASLNDRLASYIDRVRQLETENSRLTRIIQTQEDTVSKEVFNIKGLYEQELSSARKLLDDTSKEKAKLQFENGQLRSELEELREKLRQREKDISEAERRLLSAESQVNDLQAKLNDAINQRRYWEDEYNKMKKENDLIAKNLASAKKLLEDETILRVDLENRMQSLREELAFKSQIHEQELNESMHRSRVVVEETDSKLQQDYDSRLREALYDMRQQNEDQLRAMREETETSLQKKIVDLRDQAVRSDGAAERAQSELRSARKRIDELSVEISKLGSTNQASEARVRELESQLKRAHDEQQAMMDSLNAEIRRLRMNLEEQLQEYRDLMDVKIQLDCEIAAYRKLLESEETRLNIASPSVDSGRAPGESSRKRKRVDQDSFFGAAGDSSSTPCRSLLRDATSKADFVCKKSAVDVVQLSEISDEGKFIKLINTSTDKDVSIGGWLLRHTVGDDETTYKFHRSVLLKAQHELTVWSSDSEQTHNPPTDFVMKGQTWHAGDAMKTALLDTKGEEQASCDMKRSQKHTSTTLVHTIEDVDLTNERRKSTSKWGWSLFSS